MPFTFNFGGFNPGDFGQGGERPQRERKPRKPIGTPVTRTLINIAVTALVGLVYFYVELPALNPHAEEFYFFVFLLCAVYCGCAVLTSGFQGSGAKGYFGFVKKQCTIPFLVLVALIAAIIIGGLYVIEVMSDIIQVTSFKLTHKRVFKMAPIHHHFELLGWSESKVVVRFWMIEFLFMIVGLMMFYVDWVSRSGLLFV